MGTPAPALLRLRRFCALGFGSAVTFMAVWCFALAVDARNDAERAHAAGASELRAGRLADAFDQATQAIEALERYRPWDVLGSGTVLYARSLALRARAAAVLGTRGTAESDADLAHATAPTDSQTALDCSEVFLRFGRSDAAERAIRVVEGNGGSPEEVAIRRSRVAEIRGGLAARISILRVAHGENPTSFRIAMLLGDSLCDQRDLEGSAEAYRSATDIDPSDASAWAKLGFMLSVRVPTADAVAALARALKLDPRNTTALIGAANCRLTESNLTAARRGFEHACEVDPASHLAWYFRGIAERMAGAHEAAVASLRMAHRLDPDGFATTRALVRTLELAGEHSEAAEFAARFRRRHGSHPQLQEILDLVQADAQNDPAHER